MTTRKQKAVTEVIALGEERARETAKSFTESQKAREEKAEAARKKHVSAAGSIPNLPPLLEARRLKYLIPDFFFKAQACNNRINVFQIADDDGDTFGDTLIHKPEALMARNMQEAPRGILLNGGLKAMDHMYGNGYGLGHIINFLKSNPYRMPVGFIDGQPVHIQVMTCGDVSDSYDLALYIRAGLVKIARRQYMIHNDDGSEVAAHEHYLQDTKTGEVWDPSTAKMLEEEANA